MTEETKKKADLIVKTAYYALLLGLAYLALKVVAILLPFLLAIGLTALFQPLIRIIHRKMRINRKAAGVIVMALFHFGIGGLIFWVVLQITFALRGFFEDFPEKFAEIAETMSRRIPDEISSVMPEFPQNLITAAAEEGVVYITAFLGVIPAFVMTLVFTVLLSFFVSFSYDKVVKFIREQLPPKGVELAANLKKLSTNTLFRYIKAMLLIMLITFAELTAGLLILRVPNAVGIAAAIAFFDFLPVLGAGFIMTIWVIIEVIGGNYTAAIGLGVLGVVVTVVRNFIEPKIVGDRLGINPIAVLVSVFAGYKLFGAIGMILFPLLMQILLVLHKNGTIKLYKERKFE
jgi:sporulation integral membrane protein YtvI